MDLLFKEYNDRIDKVITPVFVLLACHKNMTLLNNFNHAFVDKIYFNIQEVKQNYKDIGVYIFFNKETSEFYIGSGNVSSRKYTHLRLLKRGKENKKCINSCKSLNRRCDCFHYNWKFQQAYNRNSNFEFLSVVMKSKKEALAFEQILIDHFWNNPLFLNMARYVEYSSLGTIISEETRKKRSDSMKENYKQKPFSDISKEKISKANKGRVYSDEQRRLIRTSKANNIYSKEGLEKLQKRMLGNKYFLNMKHKPDVVESMRIKQKLRYKLTPMTEETKQKISNSKKLVISNRFKNGWLSPRSIPVEIEGKKYPSANRAAKDLGIKTDTLLVRLKSKNPRFKNWNKITIEEFLTQ